MLLDSGGASLPQLKRQPVGPRARGANVTAESSGSWRRIVAEGAAILLSILLAFAIQAWWDDHQEVVEARRLLRSVIEDVRQDLSYVASDDTYHEAVVTSARHLLELSGTGREPDSPAQMDSLLADLTWWRGSDHWHTGAVDVLTSGGRLDVIRDDDLRIRLASWGAFVADIRATEDQEYDFFVTTLLPFLRTKASLPQLGDVAQVLPGTGRKYSYGRFDFSSARTDHRRLLRSTEFQNLMVQKVWLQLDIMRQHELFADEAASLITQLEAELARLGG